MRKILKIILAIIAVIIILVVAFAAVIFLDLAAYTATGSQTLTPTGTSTGNALVAYDPGLSAADLQAQNYTVTLAGIKSSDAANATGYSIIVVGGPIYAGSPTASVKDCLNSLVPDQDAKVGVFGSGQGATTPEDIAQIKSSVPALGDNGILYNAVVVKIGEKEDLNARTQDFVNQLTQ
jgi:hypothetical protein